MARPIWNGAISFGLLNIPVQLYSGERSIDLHFRLLDSRDRNPVRYERINAETGEEVPWKEIVKGFEYSKGNYVVIDEKELRKAAPESTETVEVEAFVERDAIDPMYFEKPYYLVPTRKAEKGYVLLREVLEKTGRIGIARVVIRTRQYLAALLPHGDALVLNLMRFPQELVPADEFKLPSGTARSHHVTPKETEMASLLVESMTTKWNPQDFKDEFRSRLRKVIDQQIAVKRGRKVKVAPEPVAAPEATTNVVDFMALLKRSLDEGRRSAPSRAKPKGRRRAAVSRARAAKRKVS